MISTALCCALLDTCFDVVIGKLIVATWSTPKAIQKHMTYTHLYWVGYAIKIEYNHVKIIDFIIRSDIIVWVRVVCSRMTVHRTYESPEMATHQADNCIHHGVMVDVLGCVLIEHQYNWVGWINYHEFVKMVENA